jgi:hypothetical protein
LNAALCPSALLPFVLARAVRTKLQASLGRFFPRLGVDKPVQRTNYLVQVGPPRAEKDAQDVLDAEELAWAETTNGPEDAFKHGQGPGHPVVPPVITPEKLRLRVERQTLRRLPTSGAIVFTIRTYLYGIEELTREAGVAERLASAVRGWDSEVKRYKGAGVYESGLLEYLDNRSEDTGVM